MPHQRPGDDQVLLSPDTVCRRYDFSKNTLRRRVADEEFPQPVRLSEQMHRWRLADLLEWEKTLV